MVLTKDMLLTMGCVEQPESTVLRFEWLYLCQNVDVSTFEGFLWYFTDSKAS